MSGWLTRAGQLALLAVTVVGAASCGSSKTSSSLGAPVSGRSGVVYIESNIAQPDGKSVLAFRYHGAGDLQPLLIGEYPTGGSGSADLTDSGVLDADQHLWLDTPKHLLFAVNGGSAALAGSVGR